MTDRIDNRLIAALRRNGRASISELAASLGLARATIRSRMQRLEARGEILGYSVIVKGDAAPTPVRGIMLLSIEGQGIERAISRLDRVAEVTAIHTTNGRWDLMLELGADTLDALDAVLVRIRAIDGIAQSETNLLLATRRAARPVGTPGR